ncbi:MAG: nitroreductase family deazaflavin-dependent oxidoreductase [Anaerolineales bacterium]
MGLGSYLGHPARGGSRMLVLTSRGRKSGQPRHTMVSAVDVEGRDYIVSGWGHRSQWVKNVENDPLVTVQVYRRTYPAVIRRVADLEEFSQVVQKMFQTGGDSHFKPWLASLGIKYSPEDMAAKRDRISMYGFDPADQEGPAPLRTDLGWVFPVLLAIVSTLIWLVIR